MNNLFFLLLCLISLSECADKRIKVLHLTFHRGCECEINAIGKELNWDLTTWFIPSLEPFFFDGYAKGNALYNIGHKRAEKIWNLHKDYFELFDVILTSDTAPLSRIFLQNGWKKPLIIWICNRIDYSDNASLDCEFPDDEYYNLLKKATLQKNVSIIAYSEFEHFYSKLKGIDTGFLTIKPTALDIKKKSETFIPVYVDKKASFFLPPYHNETIFMNLSQFLFNLGINNYCGRYNGPYDLLGFQGIIHIPYAWSNLALFENVSLGIPYFIPSASFFEQLAHTENFFHPSIHLLLNQKVFYLSEWYNPENKDFFTYFDSWEDLKNKIVKTDYVSLKKTILSKYVLHRQTMLNRWKSVIQKFNINNDYL